MSYNEMMGLRPGHSSHMAKMLHNTYSNTIMSWYWLDKYGDWIGKEETFGVNLFKQMQGTLDIIGMSPCNDEHLFISLNQSGIKHVNYYCYKNNGVTEIQTKIKKPITVKMLKSYGME